MGYLWGAIPPGIDVGPTLSVAGTSQQLTAANTSVRVTGGAGAAVTLTLPGIPQGVFDGFAVYIVTFDGAGFPTQILPQNPGGGDNIIGGSQWNLAQYAASVILQARVAAGVVNWLVTASNTFQAFPFPIQPTLAAGAQGPLSLGTILVPQGPRFAHSLWTTANAALTGGTLTITMTGLANPSSQTITAPAQATGQLFAPGNANRITAPNVGAAQGTLMAATVSTSAAFAGPTSVALQLQCW